jgi:6-phosphogluconolactonase
LLEAGLELFRTLSTLDPNDGIMLAGGHTPLELYRRAQETGLTVKATPFLSDERYVPVNDPQSNYGTISPFFCNLLPIPTDLPLEGAAEAFNDSLKTIDQIPVGLLGLGTDGHTASLFTLEDAALREERLVIPVIKQEKPDRISVTPAVLQKVQKIIILATGAEKTEMIRTLLEKPETIPAGVALTDHPDVEIWTDQKI